MELQLHEQLKLESIRRTVQQMSKEQLENVVMNLVVLDMNKTKYFIKMMSME